MTPDYVLVVEDNEDVRDSLVELLQSHGFEAVGAEHGRAALETMRALEPPCVIVLDLMMPVMDGRDFRRAQLQDPSMSSVPVVVISAYDESPERIRELRPAAFLRKPLDFDELMRVVRAHCSSDASPALAH